MSEVLDELWRDLSSACFTFCGVVRMIAVIPGVNELVLDPKMTEKMMEEPCTGGRTMTAVVAANVDVKGRILCEILGQGL